MTYEERVRTIAEEMAINDYSVSYKLYLKYSSDKHNDHFTASFYVDTWIKVLVPQFIKNARIAVKHMAHEVAAHIKWSGFSEREMENYLRDQGLIPDVEAGNDENTD